MGCSRSYRAQKQSHCDRITNLRQALVLRRRIQKQARQQQNRQQSSVATNAHPPWDAIDSSRRRRLARVESRAREAVTNELFTHGARVHTPDASEQLTADLMPLFMFLHGVLPCDNEQANTYTGTYSQ